MKVTYSAYFKTAMTGKCLSPSFLEEELWPVASSDVRRLLREEVRSWKFSILINRYLSFPFKTDLSFHWAPNQASKDIGKIFEVSVYITNLSVCFHDAYHR